ncbi:radical SAM protein [Candidatus Omnitrophota bacterium]
MKSPIYCDISITENCMFQCKMCKLWQLPRNNSELSINEWKDFIVSLEEFGSNDIRLHFGGGEPLLKEGMLDLIEFANKRGFSTVMVTNGFLIDEAMAERIAHSGLDVISISLDSMDGELHDFLRGQKGAHRRAIQTVSYLNKLGAKSISILTVITGANMKGLVDLVEWVNTNDSISSIYLQAVSQPIAMPKDAEWYKKEEGTYLWPHDEELRVRTIDKLIDFKTRGGKISNSVAQLIRFKDYFRKPDSFSKGMVCNQGDYVVYVRATGEVFLCGSKSPIGHIKKGKIKDFWHSKDADLRRKEIRACTESCLNLLNCFVDKELP